MIKAGRQLCKMKQIPSAPNFVIFSLFLLYKRLVVALETVHLVKGILKQHLKNSEILNLSTAL